MLLLATVAAVSDELTAQQSARNGHHHEPGVGEPAGLFNEADAIALARVVLGDMET
jgi:hypothetical protein